MEKDLDRPRSGEYLCGQCFAHHQPNDVLFAASRFSKNCDMRQAAHRYAFAGREDYEAWCRKGKSRVLLDWQDLPTSHWKIEEGVLRQVQDTTGEWSTQRVCPSCHSLLENVQGRLLIGWSAQGMDMTGAAQVLQQAAHAVRDFPIDIRMLPQLLQEASQKKRKSFPPLLATSTAVINFGAAFDMLSPKDDAIFANCSGVICLRQNCVKRKRI